MQHLRLLIIIGLLNLLINNAVAITNPMDIFPLTKNSVIPSKFWLDNSKPYPTNAWFTNFIIGYDVQKGSEPVNSYPYLIKVSQKGISLSYSGPRYFNEPAYPGIISGIFYQFENQLTLGAAENMNRIGVKSYHGLQATLEWTNEKGQKINAPILQGSPYITEFFSGATPLLMSRFKWLTVNKSSQEKPLDATTRYELLLDLGNNHTQTWILYTEYPIQFKWVTGSLGEKLIATNDYSGWIRLILQKDTAQNLDNDSAIIDNYSQTIPLDYTQTYFQTEKNQLYSFLWKTQNDKAPLMLSLPHHLFSTTSPTKVSYKSMKGLLQGQTNKIWTIELPLIPIEFLENKSLSPEQVIPIRDALLAETEQFTKQPFEDIGPYFTGKRLARMARLIVIADYLQEYTARNRMLKGIELFLIKKITKKTSWYFEYDTTWGGVIPSVNDYGARHYNDHHFHYGYWVYLFAVIAKFDPEWLEKPLPSKPFTPKEWIEQLIQDYASWENSSRYFPHERYQDDYAGHSWALGLVASKDGQNEQSSSEAVNAYYALGLYAQTINNKEILNWAQFLMTRELISAQTYWQIQPNSLIYNSPFTQNNQVIGNLWASKVDANSFFIKCTTEYRCGLEFSFGIQMLPFTAISSYLLNKEWLRYSYTTLDKLIKENNKPISPAWKWILIKGMSFVMNKTEKKYFFQQAINSKIEEYDDGDSKTNTLYFLADD